VLPSGVEGAQARGEEIRIPAPVWMMCSNEIPATAADFASLGFVHLRMATACAHRPGAEVVSTAGSG
jgi:hypothetical protein